MSEPARPAGGRGDEENDQRWTRRFLTRANATILRDSDVMRRGVPAVINDVSVGGLGLVTTERLDENEQLKLRLRNEIQRFDKEVRGVVRRVSQREDGTFHAGVELLVRLTPLEVSFMRSMIPPGEDSNTAWV